MDERTNPPNSATQFNLAGKVALVTGGGQGLGRDLSIALANAGATLVIADQDLTNASETSALITGLGGAATPVEVDVSDETSVSKLVAQSLADQGSIDVLVNNAAIFSTITMKPFEDIPLGEWQRIIDVNLTGVFLCARAVSPIMREQRSGSIINISSSTVLGGRPHYLHYVTSKSGVVGLTRGLARELGGDHITVNTIMPGSLETGIERDSARPDSVQSIINNQSLPRRLSTSDVCGSVVFLASDGARGITGQTLVVDGGMNFL